MPRLPTRFVLGAATLLLLLSHSSAAETPAQHWSVQPVSKAFPDGTSIDSLIAATLAEHRLNPSQEADRRTLLRRLTFDLHGLPPTPERLEQFARDPDPHAYTKIVDELLASPHYGERWARHWLDIAHYADTHGFERDQIRPNAWRYRDYVIASLNADKPYDQFLREQIAGDHIAPADPDSNIATGFLAAGPWDFVGHAETKSPMLKRAARAGDLDDILTQVITSTMAITINCARCHDHKLDPISQREYFSLAAVFSGITRGERPVTTTTKDRPTPASQLAAILAEILRLSGDGIDLADTVGGGDGRGSGTKGAGIILGSGAASSAKLQYHRGITPNSLRPPAFDPKTKHPNFIRGVFLPDARKDPGTVTLDEDFSLSSLPETSGESWDAIRNGPLNAQVHSIARATDFSKPGHSILGLHANAGITFDLAAIRAAHGPGPLHFSATLGFGANPAAAASKADFAVFIDSTRSLHHPGLQKSDSLDIELPIPESARFLTLVATDGGDSISHDLLFLGDPKLHHPPKSDADRAALQQLKAEAARLRDSMPNLADPPKVYAVLSTEFPPPIRIHRRGDPEDEGAEVTPGAFSWPNHAPANFGDNTSPEGQRRQNLAAWITHPDNPLTRRVLVNRLWHHHFGSGIVPTPSDFGLGGAPPSHPHLLDFLAHQLLESGWSLKHIHRLIVTSATYRQQSSTHNPDAHAIDASNRLLWRQNPRRLDAESLRDAVLHVSGSLNLQPGGPGFRDFKFTDGYAPVYEYTTPDSPDLWRRSIYRFVVRTTPHQFLSALDCPDPANLTPARIQTTTALQALTLSNSGFMLHQAQLFAARLGKESSNPEDAIRRAFALAFQRPPTSDESAAASTLVSSHGLFALCRSLLNANEFVYLD